MPLPDRAGDQAAIDAARRDVMAAIGRAADGPQVLVIKPDVPADVFVNALSQSLDLSAVERQSLLECDGVLERYQRLRSILDFRQLERAGHPARRAHRPLTAAGPAGVQGLLTVAGWAAAGRREATRRMGSSAA